MSAQDNTERVLRSLYVMVSKSEIYEFDEDKIVIDKERITNLLTELKECIYDMMDEYEMTKESRDHAEREFQKQADEIVLDASHKAEDVYAASVMYTDEALGNVQQIMLEAEESVKQVYENMLTKLAEERRTVQTNQTDLQSQLQDLADTDKYVKLINERNREIRKEKEKEQRLARRQREADIYADRQTEIRVDQEVLKKLGLASDDLDADTVEGEPASDGVPGMSGDNGQDSAGGKAAYAEPEVRVNQDVLKKLGLAQQAENAAQPSSGAQQNISGRRQEGSVQQDARRDRQEGGVQQDARRDRLEDGMQQDLRSVRSEDGVYQNTSGAQAADSAQLQVNTEEEPDEEYLRQQMLERARELDRKKARMRQRQSRQYEDPGEISLMDLNPFSEKEENADAIEDELIRLDLDADYFKWKEEQDAQFDAGVAKAKAKRRTRKK